MIFKFKNRQFECSKSHLMGILNVTPDSFSDGSEFNDPRQAVDHAVAMHEAGAEIIDIGGESTRPGALEISVEEEINRVIPVVSKLKTTHPEIVISIDTTKASVAEAAMQEGADIINDISGLQYDPAIANIAAEYNAGLILMHMRGTPATMKALCVYDDLIAEIKTFLVDAVAKAVSADLPKENIILDPGIGFAKTPAQNIEIMQHIADFADLGYPLLVGPSRKSFIGKILNETEPKKRIWGTAGAIAYLVMKKIAFIRVHDVREMQDVVKVIQQMTE